METDVQGTKQKYEEYGQKFFGYGLVATVVFSLLYWAFRSWMAPTIQLDSEAHAAWLIGLGSIAVGVAGAWVAIKIAQIATNAQLEANRFDNPFYQQAVELTKSARQVAVAFELVMAGYNRTRTQSYIAGNADYRPLRRAIGQAKELLAEHLINQGVFSYFMEVERKAGNFDRLPAIVQNLFSAFDRVAGDLKGDKGETEANSDYEVFVLALATLEPLIKLIEQIPALDILAKQLEDGIREEKLTEPPRIQVSPYLRREMSRVKAEYLRAIESKMDISVIHENEAVKSLGDYLIRQCYQRISNADGYVALESEKLEPAKKLARDAYRRNYPEDSRSDGHKTNHIPHLLLELGEAPCVEAVINKAIENYWHELGQKEPIRYLDDLYDCIAWGACKVDVELILKREERAGQEDELSKASFHAEKIAKSIRKDEEHFYVILVNSHADFYSKFYLSRLLPWCAVIWKGYPYLPNPGVAIKGLLEEGRLSPAVGMKPNPFGVFYTSTPLIIMGALTRDIKMTSGTNATDIRGMIKQDVVVISA